MNDVIYKTSLGITSLIYRIISALLILVILFYFHLRPVVFSIFLGLLVLFLIRIESDTICIYRNMFILLRKSVIPFFNKKYKYNYEELKRVVFEKGEWNPLLDLFPLSLYPTNFGKELKIYHNDKDKNMIVIKGIYLKKNELKKCVELINERISN